MPTAVRDSRKCHSIQYWQYIRYQLSLEYDIT